MLIPLLLLARLIVAEGFRLSKNQIGVNFLLNVYKVVLGSHMQVGASGAYHILGAFDLRKCISLKAETYDSVSMGRGVSNELEGLLELRARLSTYL